MEKSLSIYWCSVLIIIQFFFFTNSNDIFDIRQSRNVFFIAAFIISALYFKKKKICGSKILLPILPLIAIMKMPQAWEFHSIIQLLSFIAGIGCLIQFSNARLNLTTITNTFAFTCLLQSVWMILNWFGFDPLQLIAYQFKFGGVVGSLGNRGFSMGLISMTFPFMFSGSWRYFLIFPFIALYISHLYGTDTPLALFLFTIISMAIFKIRPRFLSFFQWSTFISIAALMLYNIDKIRLTAWQYAINLKNSWYGRGFGWIPAEFKKYLLYYSENSKPKHFGELHNEYLEAIISMGPFSLIIFYFVFLAVFKINTNLKMFWISAIVTLLYSISWHPFHVATTALVGILVFGVLLEDQGNL